MNSKNIFCSLRLHTIFCLSLLTVFPLVSSAMTELLLQLDTSQKFDSNPLRFTNGDDFKNSGNYAKKNDAIIMADVRTAIIYPIISPETRVLFIGQIGRRDFNQFSQLDNTEYSYKTTFEWRYSQLWRGAISLGQSKQLYSYSDGSLTDREMTQTKNESAEWSFLVSPDIEIPFSVRKRKVMYQRPENELFESQERIIDLGVRYKSSTSSSVRTGIRSNGVDFPRRTEQQVESLDTHYRDNEFYVDSDWQYSILTRFSGRISVLSRNYERLSQKDFSALTTEVKLNHDYSPKTKINLDVWNRPYGATDRTTLYTIGTGIKAGLNWQLMPKTRLTFQAEKEIQRYQSVFLNPGQTNPKLNRIRWGGGVVYALERDIRIYIDFLKDRLDRGSLGTPIDQNVVKLGVEYSFENTSGLARRTGFADRR